MVLPLNAGNAPPRSRMPEETFSSCALGIPTGWVMQKMYVHLYLEEEEVARSEQLDRCLTSQPTGQSTLKL